MPSIDKHVEISKQRTGRSYCEVHEWIDDPPHKNEHHDITKIPDTFAMFKEKYGEEAAREYVQHLADDLNGNSRFTMHYTPGVAWMWPKGKHRGLNHGNG